MTWQPGSIGNILKSAPGYDYFGGEIRAIKQAVRELQTARSGNRMTIDGKPGITVINGGAVEIDDGGGVTINDGGALVMVTPQGHTVLQVSRTIIPDGSGRTQQTFLLGRDDGTVVFYIADFGTVPGHPHQQSWAFVDRAQNVVFAEDTVSGHGLANPYIPAGVFMDITPPTATTTSGSFVGLQWADCFQQHPKLTASILAQTAAGTAAQVRMTVGGTQIGSTLTVPAATFGQFTIAAASWPGTFVNGQRLTVQLEARVTSGTGTIGVRGLGLWGVQS